MRDSRRDVETDQIMTQIAEAHGIPKNKIEFVTISEQSDDLDIAAVDCPKPRGAKIYEASWTTGFVRYRFVSELLKRQDLKLSI